ncbi:MAG: hypothetical protein BGO49_24125 [Planctomycetales bacterium 71-10]|nr:MAG: hypothetical protein BGO49_24125 [Planctomycetales bacterium 71-10]
MVARDYFTQGNTLDAIEPLPELRPAEARERFLDTGRIVANPVEEGAELPALRVSWRMPPEPVAPAAFNPTIGFKLHRADRLDPLRHRPSEQGIAPVPERAVRVLPEAVFRATPATIELRGLIQDGQPTADWKPAAEASTLWTVPAAPATPAEAFPFDYTFRRFDTGSDTRHESQPRWLHKEILDVLQQLLTLLERPDLGGYVGASIAYQPRGRMDDKADPLVARDREDDPKRVARFLTGFGPFSSLHTDGDDPYGWTAAEAIGLSCEFILLDIEGEPIPIDALIRERDLLGVLRANWGSTVRPPVSLGLFLADDGTTHLNVLRLTHAEPWPTLEQPDSRLRLGVALKAAVLGRDPEHPPADDAAIDGSPAARTAVNAWAVAASARMVRGLTVAAGGGKAVVYRRSPGATPAPANILPIDRHGQVEVFLPIPDRFAHIYDIAAEIERRYDLAWSRIQPAPETAAAATDFIPFAFLRAAPVDRTKELVPHNLLATPLPGSIQAYVFAHPAEFAAAASARNAAHIQYSGQTVVLQRRIPSLDRVQGIFTAGFPGIDWTDYQEYALTLEHDERAHDAPRLHVGPGPAPTLALKPVAGTRLGLYGADRYVYPDLPAYYEYRVVAWSTAGRARSAPEATTFVTPLHDMAVFDDNNREVVPARQQPRTGPIRAVAYDAGSRRVTIEIGLVHPRRHMRDEVARLWIDGDETIEPANGQAIHYGSLPDLFLEYVVYLRTNHGPEAALEVAALTPFLAILPPMMPNRPGADPFRFQARAQDRDVHLIDGASSAQELDLTVAQDASGELRFIVTLSVGDSPPLAELIGRAHEAGEVDHLFEIMVRRGGACSGNRSRPGT